MVAWDKHHAPDPGAVIPRQPPTCTASLSGLGTLSSGLVRPAICSPSRLLARLQRRPRRQQDEWVARQISTADDQTHKQGHAKAVLADEQLRPRDWVAAATPEGHVALAGGKGAAQVHNHPVQCHALRLAAWLGGGQRQMWLVCGQPALQALA